MKTTTKSKVKEIAQSIFFEHIQPNLEEPLLLGKDKECVITGIEKGIVLALNQGRKW